MPFGSGSGQQCVTKNQHLITLKYSGANNHQQAIAKSFNVIQSRVIRCATAVVQKLVDLAP